MEETTSCKLVDSTALRGLCPRWNKERKAGWAVKLSFQITLHQKDKALLEQIKSYFLVGSITKHGSESVQYRVQSRKDLAIIIDHFDKYPSITQKKSWFWTI